MEFKKPSKGSILFILVLSLHYATFGQVEFAGFSYSHFPSSVIGEDPSIQEVELSEYNFFLNLPKKLKNNKTILVNGLQYKLVTPSSDDNFDLITGSRQEFHVIGYQLIILHQMANNWQFQLMANPSLSSAFNTDLENDDFLFNGTIQFIKQKSDGFSLGGGIVFTSRFGKPRFLPALQLTVANSRSELKVFLPSQITYERFYGKVTAGLQIAVDGSRYNYNVYRINDNDELELVSNLGYTRTVVGPTLKYRIGKMIQLEASGGLVVSRRIELQGDEFDNEIFDIENGPFFQTGISLVLPKKRRTKL